MPPDTARTWRTALRLEYFTVIYNVFEAAASIVFGAAAGSIALVGFGLDSVVESLSGLILIWRLRRAWPGLAGRGGAQRTAGPAARRDHVPPARGVRAHRIRPETDRR